MALWTGLIVVLAGLGAWGLLRLYPEALASPDARANLGLSMMMLSVAAAILVRTRIRAGEALRNIALWVGILALLAVGFSFRGEFARIAGNVRADFAPGYPARAGPHEMVVSQSEDGGYYVMGQVNGQPVRFLADTGSADIVLSPADARRLGVDTAGLNYDQQAETANGIGRGAAYVADSLTVGPVGLTHVPMEINQAPMTSSLLGMTFFRQLQSFEIKDGRLYMRWGG